MNMQQPQHNTPTVPAPFASPLVSRTADASPLADDQSHPLPSAKCSALQGTTTPANHPVRRRIPQHAIDRIDHKLSDRDRAILRSVDEHQFLTASQIETLHFSQLSDTSRDRIVRRTLARLRNLRVLGTLDRQIGGPAAGSEALVHHIDVIGARLLTADDSKARDRRLRYPPTARFVRHRSAVADAHISLVTAARAKAIELLASATEPGCWRTFTGNGGMRRILKPDLYAETAIDADLLHAWFIEIDLGTESIPTLLRKCREFEAYRQTGIEQERHGGFPLVIWSITHPDPAKAERRRQALADAIAADPRLPTQLFSIVAPDALLTVIQKGGAQ